MNPLNEFRKLAGLENRTERKSWTLSESAPTFDVGEDVQVAPDTGMDSGKKGKVVSIDGGWAQIRTPTKEMLWLPNVKLAKVE